MTDKYPLAKYGGNLPPAPQWFSTAIETVPAVRDVVVDGVRLKYRQWGNVDNPGLLLSHGNAAHGNWFDFIAPYFMKDFNVVALTFSGMGDSGWRETYNSDQYSAEQIGVMKDAGMFEHKIKPIIAGHSLGGVISMISAANHGHLLKGVISLDSPIFPPEIDIEDRRPKRRSEILSKITPYPDQETALGRFRLIPEQPCENLFILDYIGRRSIKTIEQDGQTGWTWKLDPNLWQKMGRVHEGVWDILPTIACEVAFLRGKDSSLLTPDVRDHMLGQRKAPFIEIENAGHHVLIDNPLDLIAELQNLFATWN